MINQTKGKINFLNELNILTKYHYENCQPYKNMINKIGQKKYAEALEEVPFLPVQLFKIMDLFSIKKDEIFKVLTSSGTTGQQVSKIYLDKQTSVAQTKALVTVMNPILGTKRLPMIIIDSKNVIKDRKSFTARGAGILGFSNFGHHHFYLLHDDMSVDWEGLYCFLEKYKGEPILLFGFTYMVWQFFYKEAVKQGITLNLIDSLLIHGGGWKKLKDEEVDRSIFNALLKNQFGIDEVRNYYGMVEQVGSIFVECSEGYLHSPPFADIIIRDPISFHPLSFKKQGLIQVLSILPKSYPGHSLLTEDIGVIHGEDDCSCGWKGKYFSVSGRIPKAEIRGCSDTFSIEKRER
ncbi:LuxE/PaaK family acyltransferase [Robertmurraya sp. GLU-23]